MAEEHDDGREPSPRCAACGGLPVRPHATATGTVWLCPACAAAEGLGCP